MSPSEPASMTTSARSSRRTLYGMAAAVWLSFGLIQCVQSYVYAGAVGRAWSLSGSLVAGMPWWLCWLAVTPVIARVADRFPFADGRHWRSLGAHAVAGTVVATAQLLGYSFIYWFTTGQALGVATSLGNQIQRMFGSFFLESVVTYGGAAGVLVAVDFARAVRDQTLQRARLEAEAAALETLVAKARFDVLAMELNPHFLFNTLSAISGLVGQDRREEAREVVRRLGELLRRTLGNGNGSLNSVAHEVELLKDYLYIQRVRFSDRLRVDLRVDERAHDTLIPAMLIQPLVENAIRHGIEPKEGIGDVRIRIERIGTYVRIEITDSGCGFNLDARGELAQEGIGISNTRARLAHVYADAATLVLRNRSEGGAIAVVQLPVAPSVTRKPAAPSR